MVKRIAACVLVLACLVSLLVVPVSADEMSGTLNFYSQFACDGSGTSTYPDYPDSGFSSVNGTASMPISAYKYLAGFDMRIDSLSGYQYGSASWRPGILQLQPSGGAGASGSVSVYASWVLQFGSRTNITSFSYDKPSVIQYEMLYTNSLGVVGTTPREVAQDFTYQGYPGYVYKSSTVADELEPLTNFRFQPVNSPQFLFRYAGQPGGSLSYTFGVTSARVVTTASSVDTEYLESIADEIAAGNAAANAFYGDIISILNEIYQRQGEILTSVQTVQQYILEMLNSLTAIEGDVSSISNLISTYLHYLESIAQDTESIDSTLTQFHADFMTMLQTLISTITSESDDIQAKMEEIYNMLIAYLNQQFGDAVPDGIDQDITDTSDVIDQTDQIESEWQDDMTSGWGDLDLQNYTLPTSLLAGVVWVSSWFTNIFNAYGADWSQILLVPALFGIVMLAIGMISRHSGGGRGGGGRGGGGGSSDSTSNTSDGSWHYTDHY